MAELPTTPGAWVDEVLLGDSGDGPALRLGREVGRDELRRLVAEREKALNDAGLRPGGTLALNLPPSIAYVAELLAAWRIGAQVTLLDHRLTGFEVAAIADRLAPQFVVRAAGGKRPGTLRTYADVTPEITARTGCPAATDHVLVQLSSGSTGPSKVIGRTAGSLIAEVERYTRIAGSPRPGDRIVLLASMVHVLGLVGGLLYGLHAGCPLVLPERLTVGDIWATVAESDGPVVLLGVPFHAGLLASASSPPPLPALRRMTTGGELVPPAVHQAFTERYRVPLGVMYGMTEVGVIATDLDGTHRPALTPAPGITVAERDGELFIQLPDSPYLGDTDPSRFSGGWLHTRDAGVVNPAGGRVTVLGRRDSQISVGGLKVDLTEVEQTLAELPGVTAAVVAYAQGIEAYVETGVAPAELEAAAARRLAAYKRPRRLHVLDSLPRTTTGKLVRDRAALRAAAGISREDSTHE